MCLVYKEVGEWPQSPRAWPCRAVGATVWVLVTESGSSERQALLPTESPIFPASEMF